MPNASRRLYERVLSRLEARISEELNPWLRDDLRIALLTVVHAAKGDAVFCSPHVLASYEVLGLHPDKVWPAILARTKALAGPQASGVPKKPPESVKLWSEKTKGARAANSHAQLQEGSPRTTISVPMAAPSIAALYPNPQAPASGKSRRVYTYSEWIIIVRHSFAPPSVKAVTLNALTARGEYPGEDGPAHGMICVSLDAMSLGDKEGAGQCVKRTTQRRVKRACDLNYWRRTHRANRWMNCPKCGAARETAKCAACGHRGRSLHPDGSTNTKEFCRPFSYLVDLQRFLTAPPPKGIRHFCARTWKEHREAAKHGEHPNVRQFPSPPQNEPPPKTPAPARPQNEPLRKTAEHQQIVTTEITARATRSALHVFEFCGLADQGLIEKIKIGVMAEAKFQGIEIEDAAKQIAEVALRHQKEGTALNGFYWRDLKWRTNGGQVSLAASRSERVKRAILNGFAKDVGAGDSPDVPERENGGG